MACDPSSLSNLYQDHEEVAKHFACVIYNLTKHSTNYTKEDFKRHELHLCEAYCLLWQNAATGQVDGRMFGLQLKIGVFAALFVDLYAANLIELTKDKQEIHFRLLDTNQNHYSGLLEIAVFDTMRNAKLNGKLHDTTLWKWLIRAVDADCVETTFDSLVARGILHEKSGILGKRYPTVNPEPELNLEQLIKQIVVGEVLPDSYMLTLLVLSRESDRMFLCKDPILKKHFSSAEYNSAVKNLDRILASYLNVS